MKLLVPVVLAAASAAAAQSTPSGLVGGQLVLYNPALNGISSSSGGIALVDPLTGAVVKPYSFFSTPQVQDGMAYDPFRDRLIFGAVFNNGDPVELWAGDASGAVQSLGFAGVTCRAFAPTGDGRIFLRADTQPNPNAIRWIDAAGQVHLLEDGNTGQPWQAASANWWGQLEYSAKHNALLLASGGFLGPCGGPEPSVTRLDLSADGTKIVAETCVSFQVDSGGGGVPVGLGAIDADQFLLTIDTNSSQNQPRILRVQVDPLAISVYSFMDHFGAAATNAGTFSHARGQAVILDTGQDVLRAYSPGQGGAGTEFGPTGQLSVPGASGEIATLIEVAPAGAAGGLTTSGATTISVAAGGTQAWNLDAGPSFAGRPYLILGSATGFAPGFVLDGTLVPLNPDVYTDFTIANANSTLLTSTFGLLDGTGSASASFNLPAGASPSLAGLTLHHAAIAYGPIFSIDYASNPVAVQLVP